MQQSDARTVPRLPWSIVWALSVTQIVSWGSIYYAISVLLAPIEAELGWSRDAIIGAFSLSLLCAAFGAYPVGAWIDRHGGRSLMASGSVLAAVLFALMSRTQSLAEFYVLWAGLGVSMAMLLYEPAFAVVTHSFGDSARKGITVLALSGGFASTVFWPLTQSLVAALGWRQALLALALCNLLVCAPLHWWFLPSAVSHAVAVGKPKDQAGPGMRGILASRTFWMLAVAFTGNMLAFSALSVHIVPLLHEKGYAMDQVVWIAAIIGPMQVAGRIGEFTVGARFRATQVAMLAFALLPVAFVCLSYAASPWVVILAFVLPYGASNGVMTIVRGIIPVELFGRERYGAVNGALATPVAAARALGPFIAAMIWTATGGYSAVLWSLAGVGVFSLGAFALAVGRYRKD